VSDTGFQYSGLSGTIHAESTAFERIALAAARLTLQAIAADNGYTMEVLIDSQPQLDRLAEALADESREPDPAYLGLLIAAQFYPGLDVERYLQRVDALAERVRVRLGRGRSPLRVIQAINGVLFGEEGFAGNLEDYYDPRNSFLNEVLDRKTGIPISLSAVYLAVAHRLGHPVSGVGLPMHFIVKVPSGKGDIYVDPFHGGSILSVQDCQERIERAYGAPVEFNDSYLNAVPTRMMLYRMLNNLKYIYLKRQDFSRAGRAVELMLLVVPDQPEELRDRGLLHFQERNWAKAADYLARYLRKNPAATDVESAAKRLTQAHENLARRN
jgi:regulator of sirC expression with transglutaminase-like and TPR domain